METGALKRFAQAARRQLLEQVATRLEQVLRSDSVEVREKKKVVDELKKQIQASSREAVGDQVAYTWFNRFCALRFMDVNHYTRVGIVSPVEGFTQPEILQEAKQGVIDESIKVDNKLIFGLLNGQFPSTNPQQEAYRLLLVGACNAYHAQMPFLFPEIEDYTELLMPDDLLSENAVLQGVLETLTAETCHDVEVIGWLYQYYISERKDEVFAALKENQKIEAKDIPAATQLFTPHWIVRYLVENSLGRLWMLNHPDSKLIDRMEYYIRPVQEETDFLKITSPEEIKLGDPACGSGHMLTYAFNLLCAIYEEQGYDPVEIPSLILQKNLYGIEIDKRAGDLAAFALVMKAREKDRRFFSRGVEPNICVLENISFTASELEAYKKKVGDDLFTQDLWFLLGQFEQADNFGSLIQPQIRYPEQLLERLQELGVFEDLLLYSTNEKVKQVLRQAEYLSPRYHVVVANPPYMGGNGMNDDLRQFARDHFPTSKSDLFAIFIERIIALSTDNAFIGLMAPFTWMFLTSYETLRKRLVMENTLIDLVRPEYHAFFDSAYVPICAFNLSKSSNKGFQGTFIDLTQFYGANLQSVKTLEAIHNPDCGWLYHASANDFIKIPGSPISYWVSDSIRDVFKKNKPLSNIMLPRKGIATGNNDRFLRFWHEVEALRIVFPENVGKQSGKWYATTKGGMFRKWYGNHEYVVNWQNDGYEIKNYRNPDGSLKSRPQNTDYFFKGGITWSDITSSKNAFRKLPTGFAFEGRGPGGFFENTNYFAPTLGFLNSKISSYVIQFLNPTLSLNVGEISKLPFKQDIIDNSRITEIVNRCISYSQTDWDSFETSWDFGVMPLLWDEHNNTSLKNSFQSLRNNWQETINELQHLEEENNQILINSYGLQDELTYEVSLEEISLICNPKYRYGNNKREDELGTLLLEDTMKEFISYAVGCMFGRYSLDKPGLILANAGETVEDYLIRVPEPSFAPDEDNVIPILEGEWFNDDIVERFKQFLKVSFGAEHYEENLAFIEEAIGKDIRSYFVRDFYNEHVKMYKKRPIYWLFSSPKGSFNTLIYMHRYQLDTISIILNTYLRPYSDKLNAHKSQQEAVARNPSASQGEKIKAQKEVDWVNKVLSELREYENEILYPLATQQIKIDLDDGVKVNYRKFGKALKPIAGL